MKVMGSHGIEICVFSFGFPGPFWYNPTDPSTTRVERTDQNTTLRSSTKARPVSMPRQGENSRENERIRPLKIDGWFRCIPFLK